jgi:hypothetical protein
MNYDGDLLALDFCIPIKLAGNMSLNFRKSFISTGYQAKEYYPPSPTCSTNQ